MLLSVVSTVMVFFCPISTQFHYLPAQVLIPTFNSSTNPLLIHGSSNTTNNIGWNNPLLNKTGASSNRYNLTNANGDLIVGKITYNDHRLFNQVYSKGRKLWTSREKIIDYPHDLPGYYGRHETISAIRIYNQFHDRLDSKAKILSGGVGKRFVKIKLSSKAGKGFNYLVQIFGH